MLKLILQSHKRKHLKVEGQGKVVGRAKANKRNRRQLQQFYAITEESQLSFHHQQQDQETVIK